MKYILSIMKPDASPDTHVLEERPAIDERLGFVRVFGTSLGSNYEVYLSPHATPSWSLSEIDDDTALNFVEQDMGPQARKEAVELWGLEGE